MGMILGLIALFHFAVIMHSFQQQQQQQQQQIRFFFFFLCVCANSSTYIVHFKTFIGFALSV